MDKILVILPPIRQRKVKVGTKTYPLLNKEEKQTLGDTVENRYFYYHKTEGWGRNMSLRKVADELNIALEVAHEIVIRERSLEKKERVQRWIP